MLGLSEPKQFFLSTNNLFIFFQVNYRHPISPGKTGKRVVFQMLTGNIWKYELKGRYTLAGRHNLHSRAAKFNIGEKSGSGKSFGYVDRVLAINKSSVLTLVYFLHY